MNKAPSETQWNCFCDIDGCAREFSGADPMRVAVELAVHAQNSHGRNLAPVEARRAVKVVPAPQTQETQKEPNA